MEFIQQPARDVMVMGRANVDLYVADPADSLENSLRFEKSVGGSAANIAVGLAKLGRSVDFLSKVSDDQFGDFVSSFLERHGVGTEFLDKDRSGSLTSLAFAERKKVDSRVLFYRNGASDLMIRIEDIPVDEFARTAVLVCTGTGLSASPSREATLFAMEAAAAAGTKVVFDLDWRASAWESVATAGLIYRIAAERSHIIVGTREEMAVLSGSAPGGDDTSDAEAAGRLLGGMTELVIIKRGVEGSTAYSADGASWSAGVFPVEVRKNYGAGDAFAAALLHGLLQGLTPDAAMTWGAGAAGIVVADTACAESAPTFDELQRFVASFEE
ncbi:MAG: 5-dehydro-2-deoxygluconokinase [Spirochaetales bacterium]|nr:5-dehydro-2-deoxygluconokinase [Spirochaetales bacterium]